MGIFGGNDLALFSEPDLPVHGARWLREDGFVARAAPSANGAAAAMKQPQLHAPGLAQGQEQLGQCDFGPIELPVAGEGAAVLVAVAVTQHDVLLGARALHHRTDAGQRIESPHDELCALQVANGFKQRDHDQLARGIVCECALQQPRFLEQQQHFQQVTHVFGVRDDVVPDRMGPEPLQHLQGHLEDVEFAAYMVAVSRPVNAQWARVVQHAQQQSAAIVL